MPESLSLKRQLIGTWMLASWKQKKGGGARVQRYGENPVGIAFFDSGGRYIITVMRVDRPKYASNALWQAPAKKTKRQPTGP